MAICKISEARLRLIKKRQWSDAWGPDYVAAQWATPKEAPGLSTASILHPEKLGGRACHTLSQNETWVTLLALYHPDVWEIHEQRVLFPQPRPHPLQGHPKALGQKFEPFRGTLEVAQKMGTLSKHPKCRVTLDDRSVVYAPFLYLGDLLIFLMDDGGAYAVNLSVKDKLESFRRQGPRPGKPDIHKDHAGTVNRHALEKRYYEDAGIPTRQVVGREIDLDLRVNLIDLFLCHAESTAIPEAVKHQMWIFFASSIGLNKNACVLINAAANHFKFDPAEVRTVLMQGIWRRHIKVDLFKPLLMDRPLRPMVDDPLQSYKEWFQRG